jgi:hypothetical protein
MLLEELECTLLGLVTGLCEVLQRLLAGSTGLAAYNTATLVHEQVGLCQATACVLGCAVENLGTRARCDHTTGHRGGSIVTACILAAVAAHVLACSRHLFLTKEHIFFKPRRFHISRFLGRNYCSLQPLFNAFKLGKRV